MYDIIIIGSGPAGIAAALYAARVNLNILLFEKNNFGGQLNNIFKIDNYPGFINISGKKLSNYMHKNLKKFFVNIKYKYIKKIINYINYKKVISYDNKVYYSKFIIIATGSKFKKLNVPGENEYFGKGVSYCAICDGFFFRNKKILVVGGGKTAIDSSIYLAKFVKKIYLIHRRKENLNFINKNIFLNNNIEIKFNYILKRIIGNKNFVEKCIIQNILTNKIEKLDINGIFIFIGFKPLVKEFNNLKIFNKNGWIITNNFMETKEKGIFAIGDVRNESNRQIVNAVSDGSIVINKILKLINKNNKYI